MCLHIILPRWGTQEAILYFCEYVSIQQCINSSFVIFQTTTPEFYEKDSQDLFNFISQQSWSRTVPFLFVEKF